MKAAHGATNTSGEVHDWVALAADSGFDPDVVDFES
jgi:hypothetical protein